MTDIAELEAARNLVAQAEEHLAPDDPLKLVLKAIETIGILTVQIIQLRERVKVLESDPTDTSTPTDTVTSVLLVAVRDLQVRIKQLENPNPGGSIEASLGLSD